MRDRRTESTLAYIVIALVLAWFLAVALISTHAVELTAADEPAVLPRPAFDWASSRETSPPENVPVIGVWADNGLEVEATIYWYDAWYEYAPTVVPPVGGYLNQAPPSWWAPMPGAAR